MIEVDAVRSAIGKVEDPEFRQTLDALDMLRTLDISADGEVRVLVALAGGDGSSQDQLTTRITAAAQTVDGVAAVRVEYSVMTDAERAALVAKVRGTAGVNGPNSTEISFGQPGNKTRIITISSGKGGVGKSSVTVNLAVALTKLGKRVGIIDADVWGFSIPKMLGVDQTPNVVDDLLLPPHAYGVAIMSMDYFVPDDQAVIWRGPMLHKAMEQFLVDVVWGDPDYLLIDLPPGTGDISISLSQFLPRAQSILVTTPQVTAQRVAKRAGLMANKVDQEIVGVVENMSWFTGNDGERYEIFGSGGGAALAKEMDIPLLAQIPLVPAMRIGADEGQPVIVADPDGEAAAAFAALAEAVEARRPRVRSHPELVIR
ncbi:flagellum site-determining protein YlxH [bacterium BMS3Bbin02]|nr:flagellum site-determining protein YlxH [bacterium BMS3Bbin02]